MKPITKYNEQVELLKDRGLIIPNENRLKHYLKHIGYYRLSGHFKAFQDNDNTFNEIDFETILQTYIFDRKIRLLLLDAIERIEISFKAQICDQMCFISADSLWYSKKENFAQDKHGKSFETVNDRIKGAIENSKEIWINEYESKNGKGSKPPSWMICNILTFGQLSTVFSNLANPYQKRIAKNYGLTGKVLRTWMRSLTSVRNICAHHNRLWNRSLDASFFTPKFLKSYELDPAKLFFTLVSVSILMNKISPGSEWSLEVKKLLVEFSKVPREKMGFPKNWETIFDEVTKINVSEDNA